MKRDNKLSKEDFYHQFHNFQASSTEHADDREPHPKDGRVGHVGPVVHFRKDHARATTKPPREVPQSGTDAVQKAVYIARQHKRGRP